MKRALGITLAVILCFSLIGCGANSHEGEVKTPEVSSEMEGRNYEDVVRIFEGKGFTNIKTEPIEDLIFGWLAKDGEVEEVSVGGDVEYSKNKWVAADVEVVIRYHTFPKGDKEETEQETDPSKPVEETTITTEPIDTTAPSEESPADTTPVVTPKIVALENCTVGDIVEFGSYPYYADGTKESIKWLVLEVKDNKALLISCHILDVAQYHSAWEEVTWEKSALRKWMNGSFYNNAFSNSDRDRIVSVENENPENKYSGFAAISGGFDTKDKVFALCTAEVVEYFGVEVRGFHNPKNTTEALATEWTEYAISRQDPDDEYGYRGWFTRSPASTRKEVAFVSANGYAFNSYSVQGNQGVRPAVWIKLG